ncbi:hypothetical protein [Homoserinibacter sp. YIM 151385]|uniref:hypothetical protein n=1 Tax=Homoserinibacter sp. YIM 151385 TaxID=2985506 RepID=UPI0022F0BA80|nr:hypothetical protein [Homoserinibacter sp. YIM 151385]WBU39054.1 hypothetical protein OF852_05600 [Homoserinibacter sp. YIM 151385]
MKTESQRTTAAGRTASHPLGLPVDLLGQGPRARHGLRARRLHSGLWRVTRLDGAVLGYIEPIERAGAVRYLAKRMRPQDASFRMLGEVWTADDAVELLLDV